MTSVLLRTVSRLSDKNMNISMYRRITKCIAVALVLALCLIVMPFNSVNVNAAGNLYESSLKEYNLGAGNKGYYLEPSGDGQYPALIFVHGSGRISGIPKDTFRNLLEYWTAMGYMDEMVIIIPGIEQGSYSLEHEAFRDWAQNKSGLLGQKIKNGTFSSKIDTSAEISVTGYSMGGCAALGSGIAFKEYYTQVGGFSSSFFLYSEGDEGTWFKNWYETPAELTFADGAEVFISYGKGEVDSNGANIFKNSSNRYYTRMKANNNSSVSISLYPFDSCYGNHAWKLFSAELFTFLYWQKTGTMPGDDLIKSALTIPSTVNCAVTFNANGHGSAPSAQTVQSGNKATKPTDPTASGYTFCGWYTDSACTTAYNFDTAVTSDITLYAKWTAVSTTTPDPATPAPTGTINPAPVETPKLTTGIAHVQDIGDVSVVADSSGMLTIGTTGMGKRLEQITINFENNTPYSGTLEYRVHVQDYGWMGWAKNGECAGTAGRSARLEGIQIVLVPKGGAAPAATYDGITSVTEKAFIEGF